MALGRASRSAVTALTAATAAGVLVLSGVAAASTAQAAPAAAVDWTEITHGHVSGQDSYLYDSYAFGEETWHVGVRRAYFGGIFEWRNLVQRCSGSSCTPTYPQDIESPPNTSNWLQGIGGTSSSDVWAVGYARYSTGTRPTIHHWNGTSWTIVSNPVASGALYGVSAIAADDVWAVGAEGGSAPQAQLVLHWDGSSWTRVPFSVKGCTAYDYLRDIDAEGKRPLVIGQCRVGSGPVEPMVASYKNGSWKREAVPVEVPDDTDFSTVAWVGNQAWVGGGSWTSTFTARLRKGTWVAQAAPVPGTVFGIEGSRPKDVWAVGTGGTSIRLALHWDGKTWTSTEAGTGGGWLESVTVTDAGEPWAAGQKSGQSLILRYDGALDTLG